MKIKHLLCASAAIALLGAGCSDDEVAGKGDLSLSIQISSAVNTITTVHVMGAKGDAKAEALAEIAVDDSLLLAEVLSDLPTGTYSLTIEGYVGDSTAPLATTSAEVTIKADAVATAALVLGPVPELLATITASNAAPKTDEMVTFSATVSGPGAEGAALIWSDDCDGDFVTNGSATVQWHSRRVDGCTVTLSASTAEAATTATLDLGVAAAKGTLTRMVGSGACSAPTQDLGDVWTAHGWVLKGNEAARSFPLTSLNGLAIDASGNLIIPERNGGRVWRWSPSTDAFTRIAGPIDPYNDSGSASGDAGPATDATFEYPFDVAVAPNGDIFVIDSWQSDLRHIYAGDMTIDTMDGNLSSYSTGVAVDAAGDIFTATAYSTNRLKKFYASNGTNMTFNSEDSWDVESHGDYVYVTNRHEHSIYRQGRSGGNVEYIAGAYDAYNDDYRVGFSGDGGFAMGAALDDPRGLFIDPADGDIFFADSGNRRIRKITQAGIISTVLVTQGTPGDLVLDAAKNMYYTDRDSCSVIKAQGPY